LFLRSPFTLLIAESEFENAAVQEKGVVDPVFGIRNAVQCGFLDEYVLV